MIALHVDACTLNYLRLVFLQFFDSVAVLAEIPLWSPDKLLICIIKKYFNRIKVSKKRYISFWKKLNCSSHMSSIRQHIHQHAYHAGFVRQYKHVVLNQNACAWNTGIDGNTRVGCVTSDCNFEMVVNVDCVHWSWNEVIVRKQFRILGDLTDTSANGYSPGAATQSIYELAVGISIHSWKIRHGACSKRVWVGL